MEVRACDLAGVCTEGLAAVFGFDRAVEAFVAIFFTAATADDFLDTDFFVVGFDLVVDTEAGFAALAAGFLPSAPLIRLSNPDALLDFFAG